SAATPSPGVSASTTVNVVGGVNVSVTKTENTATVTAGTNISYTVTVSNSGPGDAQNVSVTDAVPANATFVSESQTAGPAFIVTVKTGPASVTAGTDLTYTITLQNAGPSDAQNMLLTDSVPANTTFVSFTETSGATTYGIGTPAVGGTGTVIASAATVPANET